MTEQQIRRGQPGAGARTIAGWPSREPRVPFDFEVLAFPRNRLVRCRGVDLSATGMLLRAPAPLIDDPSLSLIFPLVVEEQQGQAAVHWVGITSWLVRCTAAEGACAVRFAEPLPWIACSLEKHVRRWCARSVEARALGRGAR